MNVDLFEIRYDHSMKQLLLSTIKNAAKYKLAHSPAKVVGITGSVGKSSCVYLLDAVMRDVRRTKTTFQSNSESGLPLEILGLRGMLQDYSALNWLQILAATPFAFLFNRFDYEVFIAEMGIDSSLPPKNMSYLLEFISPDVGVLLSVAPSHTQQFAEELGLNADDSEAILQAIADEKGLIVTKLKKNAQAVINLDFPHIRALQSKIKAKVTTVASDHPADFRLRAYDVTKDGTSFAFVYNKETYSVDVPGYILSREYGTTILAVIAVAHALGLSVKEATQRLQDNFTLPPGRMTLLDGKNDTKILDSSYNSSPVALKSVLSTVESVKGFKRKIVVLGDMRELGPLEAQAHVDIADQVAKIADQVVLVGPKMQQYLLPELQKRNVPVLSFQTSLGVGEKMLDQGLAKDGDLILVKGSQNTIFLEQTVLELMAKPELGPTVLCRQEAHWDHDRQAFWAKSQD
jgi:UDP-N-acetylmuramoyl-tripeptide--D-alanyl-D-alanine ligase